MLAFMNFHCQLYVQTVRQLLGVPESIQSDLLLFVSEECQRACCDKHFRRHTLPSTSHQAKDTGFPIPTGICNSRQCPVSNIPGMTGTQYEMAHLDSLSQQLYLSRIFA